MPKKIGKLFSNAKSKLLGSSPKKSHSGSGPSRGGAHSPDHNSLPSDSASAANAASDTDPILGLGQSSSRSKNSSRESIGAGVGLTETGSRSSSFGSSGRLKAAAAAGAPSAGSSRGGSRENVRGLGDGAEELTSRVSPSSVDGGPKPLDLAPPGGGGAQPPTGFRRFFHFGTGTALTSATGYNELYSEQKDLHDRSWWHSTLPSLATPVQFGTWDGVFVTCVVHLFGVISFLRLGWLVGETGVLTAAAIVFGCLLFTTVSLLAAIGIMDRCAAATAGTNFQQSSSGTGGNSGGGGGGVQQFDSEYPSAVGSARANVHLLISAVLGSRIGGAISLIYWFGQAVSCALHITGFAETFVQLAATFIERHLWVGPLPPGANQTLPWDARFARQLASVMWIELDYSGNSTTSGQPVVTLIITAVTYQVVSGAAILVLFLFNVVGLKCLFRLQTVLFAALVGAMLDFGAGLAVEHPDYGYGKIEVTRAHFESNLYPQLDPAATGFWPHLFTVIGVFFPSAIGVMAGVNMGADLKDPTHSIPVGSLSAIGCSYTLHLFAIVGLGLACTRTALLQDYFVSQHVAYLGWFFLLGLYMSALSSSLGSMYTAPRILQNLAQELAHHFPVARCFAAGRGPNKIPINALILFTLVTLCFVMLGGINVLAPIVTIPYLLTYATIEYAYFCMAMTFDLQIAREKRFMAIATQLRSTDGGGDGGDDGYGIENGATTPSTTRIIGSNGELFTATGSPPPNECTSLTGNNGDNASLSLLRIADIGPEPPSPTPSIQHLEGYGAVQAMTSHIKIKRRQSTHSDSDSDNTSDELTGFAGSRVGSKRNTAAAAAANRSRHVSGNSSTTAPPISPKPTTSTPTPPPISTTKAKTKTIRQLMAAESDEDSDSEADGADQEVLMTSGAQPQPPQHRTIFRFETSEMNRDHQQYSNQQQQQQQSNSHHHHHSQPRLTTEDYLAQTQPEADDDLSAQRLLNPDPELAEIGCKAASGTWYLRLINRWSVAAAAVAKVTLMFFVAWPVALVTLAAFGAFYLALGGSNPGHYPGVSEFSLFQWCRNVARKCCRHKSYPGGVVPNLVASYSYDRIVLPPTSMPNPNYQSEQLTHEGRDYSDRKAFHHSTTITTNNQFD